MRIPLLGRVVKPAALVLGVAAGVVAWVRRSNSPAQPLSVVPRATASPDGRELRTRVAASRNGRVTSRASLPATKKDLYELAKKRDIPGRSKMSKAELERALAPVLSRGQS